MASFLSIIPYFFNKKTSAFYFLKENRCLFILIVVLDSPTRGIDIQVKQDIYQLMNQMRKNGKSIIMISEELMELIGMCDRIMITKDGKISGELERDQNLDENGLITMMV